MAVSSSKIEFTGALGETLAARLDSGPGAPRAYALFAHCFTCSKDVFAATRIAEALAGQGIATLRFDFTGLGASDGEFANTNFSSNVDDLVAAADVPARTACCTGTSDRAFAWWCSRPGRSGPGGRGQGSGDDRCTV